MEAGDGRGTGNWWVVRTVGWTTVVDCGALLVVVVEARRPSHVWLVVVVRVGPWWTVVVVVVLGETARGELCRSLGLLVLLNGVGGVGDGVGCCDCECDCG